MKIPIAGNINALRVARRLDVTTSQLSSIFQRLPSGLRINSGADDPAGIAILSSLQADKMIASVAFRNTSGGISVTNIAIEGINQVILILTRMQELAQQSANGIYPNTQRSALSAEFTLLAQESDRTSATTIFNNVTLLSNSAGTYIQVGLRGNASNNSILIPQTSATLESLGIKDRFDQLTVSIIGSSAEVSQSLARNALPILDAAIETLTQRRSVLAAAENRLESAVNFLAASRENFAAAASRIGDADIAAESANLIRLQVLQNAQQAILAQANQTPALALKLLQSN